MFVQLFISYLSLMRRIGRFGPIRNARMFLTFDTSITVKVEFFFQLIYPVLEVIHLVPCRRIHSFDCFFFILFAFLKIILVCASVAFNFATIFCVCRPISNTHIYSDICAYKQASSHSREVKSGKLICGVTKPTLELLVFQWNGVF